MKHFRIMASVLVCTLFLFTGCGMFSTVQKKTKDLVGDIGGSKDGYVKTIALESLKMNPKWASLSEQGLFTAPLSEMMARECNDIDLVISGQQEFPKQLSAALKKSDGKADSFSLAITGQVFGINSIIVPRLMDITTNEKVKGVFWFRDTHRKAQIHTDVVAFHTGTGAKLFDETIFYEIEIDEPAAIQIQQGRWPDTISFPEVMAGAAAMTAEMICETLSEIPWEGYVSAVSGNQVVLPFGEVHNLKVGDVLDVIGIKNILEGAEQQRYFVPGLKTGQIKIISVSSNEADGELLEGGSVEPNSIVRIVQKK
jgi:hypothetical protein